MDHDDRGLARLDFLGGGAHLRDRAEQALAAVEPSVRPGIDQEGADDTGSVWVRVGARGLVAEVAIGGGWRDLLAAGRLGAALLGAYTRATARLAAATAAARLDAERQTGRPDPAGPADTAGRKNTAGLAMAGPADTGGPGVRPAASDGVPALDDPGWLGWVWNELGQCGLRLDELRRQRSVGAAAAGPDIVEGPAGYVRVELVGPHIERIDVADSAAAGAQAVAADAQAALRAVWHRLGGQP